MPRSYAPVVERFDVIVVGAGPSGSLTAHLLAREGVRTLLVDRARFPRDKPCGGGVTLRGARLLPFAIGPVVERQRHDDRLPPPRSSARSSTAASRRSC